MTENRRGRRPLLVEGGETGGGEKGEKRFINYGGKTVYLGEQRVLSYDEKGEPVYCKVVGFNLSEDAPRINVVFADSGKKGGGVEEEWEFGRFADLEAVKETRNGEGAPRKEGLPRMTSYERGWLDSADDEKRAAMEEKLRERFGAQEGVETKRVLLDGKEVEIVVTDTDFGTIVR